MHEMEQNLTVEIVTRDGDRLTRDVTADEARRLEVEPFREASNVAVVSVSPRRR